MESALWTLLRAAFFVDLLLRTLLCGLCFVDLLCALRFVDSALRTLLCGACFVDLLLRTLLCGLCFVNLDLWTLLLDPALQNPLWRTLHCGHLRSAKMIF